MDKTRNSLELESRVASAETAIAGLAESINKVANLVGRLESSVASGFTDINNRFTDSRKPQYALVFGTIFAAASVLLTIIGSVGKIVIDSQGRDILRTDTAIHSVESTLTDHLRTQAEINLSTAVTLGERKGVIERSASEIATLEQELKKIETRQYDNRDIIIKLDTLIDVMNKK